MRWIAVLGVGCSSTGDDDSTPTTPADVVDGDADTDADADADTDADVDTDTDVPVPSDAALLRALHVAPGVPGQDMFGNGLPGNPPLVDLTFLEGTGFVERPADTFEFTFHDTGNDEPWITFPYTLTSGSFTSFVVIGTPDDRDVLVVDEARPAPAGIVRVQWTHAAPSLASTAVVFENLVTGAPLAGGAAIAYAASVEFDETPGDEQVWIDLDASGACNSGEAFASFEPAAGEYHHLVLTEDEGGNLLLVDHVTAGVASVSIDPVLCP